MRLNLIITFFFDFISFIPHIPATILLPSGFVYVPAMYYDFTRYLAYAASVSAWCSELITACYICMSKA
jgi:hypothetical protein